MYRFLFFPLVSLLAACQGAPHFANLSRVTRSESVAIAKSYLTHSWSPTKANVRHGNDTRGIRVDTPDIAFQPSDNDIPGWWTPGQTAVGVPYQWGGFSTLTEFDEGVKKGRAAGDVYTSAKRAALDDAVSKEAVGIDCSGYISRCWKLPRSYSTRELPSLCQSIAWNELKPGDILNTNNAHCLLFAGWQDASKREIIAYETGCPPTWKAMTHPINTMWLKSLGYTAWRYRGIVDDKS
jgi:hypothetical protein